MTKKLEEKITWVVFGYGMIGTIHADIPESVDDPAIIFTHKMAVGGKFHNGQPILSAKEEKKMLKECETLVADLNANFVHSGDFVKLPDDYNQPKQARAATKPEPVVETPVEAPKATRRRKAQTTAPAPEPTPEPVVATKTRKTRKTAEEKAAEEAAAKRKEVRNAILEKGRAVLAQRRKEKREAAEREAAAAAERAKQASTVRRRTRKVTTEAPKPDVVVETPKAKRGGRRKVTEAA